jgi:hypothetical protein
VTGLIDVDRAEVVVPPPEAGPGVGLGGASCVAVNGIFWLVYRIRLLKFGSGVGVVDAIRWTVSTFKPVWEVSREAFSAASLEPSDFGCSPVQRSHREPLDKLGRVDSAHDRSELPCRGGRSVALTGTEPSGWHAIFAKRANPRGQEPLRANSPPHSAPMAQTSPSRPRSAAVRAVAERRWCSVNAARIAPDPCGPLAERRELWR